MAEPKRPMDGPKERVLGGLSPPRSLQSQKNEQMLESFVNSRHFMSL